MAASNGIYIKQYGFTLLTALMVNLLLLKTSACWNSLSLLFGPFCLSSASFFPRTSILVSQRQLLPLSLSLLFAHVLTTLVADPSSLMSSWPSSFLMSPLLLDSCTNSSLMSSSLSSSLITLRGSLTASRLPQVYRCSSREIVDLSWWINCFVCFNYLFIILLFTLPAFSFS